MYLAYHSLTDIQILIDQQKCITDSLQAMKIKIDKITILNCNVHVKYAKGACVLSQEELNLRALLLSYN